MIDHNQLTEENGFTDGTVILINGEATFFRETYYNEDEECHIISTDAGECNLDNVWEIKPLTGPMAIWNFAPEWADVYCESVGGDHLFSSIAFIPELERYRWASRPFWAKETK